MKKEYKNPEMELFQFESEQMLAASPASPLSRGEGSKNASEADAPGYLYNPDEDDEIDW